MPDAKAVVLGLAALWCLLLIGFVVTLEYIRQSIEQAAEIGAMPDAELRRALSIDGSAKGEVLTDGDGTAPVGAAISASAAAAGVSATDPDDAADPDDDTVAFDELFAHEEETPEAEDSAAEDPASEAVDAAPGHPEPEPEPTTATDTPHEKEGDR